MKAFQIDDETSDGNSVVVFANHAVVARREGATELDVEFGDVSCRRVPHFDARAPGPLADEELWAAGWWFPCVRCEERTSEEMEGHLTDLGGVCKGCRGQSSDSERISGAEKS